MARDNPKRACFIAEFRAKCGTKSRMKFDALRRSIAPGLGAKAWTSDSVSTREDCWRRRRCRVTRASSAGMPWHSSQKEDVGFAAWADFDDLVEAEKMGGGRRCRRSVGEGGVLL